MYSQHHKHNAFGYTNNIPNNISDDLRIAKLIGNANPKLVTKMVFKFDSNGIRCDHRRTGCRPAEFEYCTLISALSVWTAVSEYAQLFGVPALDLKI